MTHIFLVPSTSAMGKNNSKLSPEQLDELKINTSFNETEIRFWYKSFMKEFPNGRLNRTQFKKLYSNLFPNGDESRFVDHAFKRFDIDGDGYVDFREFMWAMSITSRGNIEQRLEWAFSMYDLDGDGFITRKEMLEIVTSIHRMVGNNKEVFKSKTTPEEQVDQIFCQMDKDLDGKLSKQEFIEGAKNDHSVSQMFWHV